MNEKERLNLRTPGTATDDPNLWDLDEKVLRVKAILVDPITGVPYASGGAAAATDVSALNKEVTQGSVLVRLTNIDTKTPPLGQAFRAASSPVTIASDQPAIPVNQNQMNGTAISTGPGASAPGTQRVMLSTDSPLAPNAATETTLVAVKTALLAQLELSSTLWTDNSNAFYVRRDIVNEGTGVITIAWTDPTGVATTPGAGLKPAASGAASVAANRVIQQALYDATAAGTGYAAGDILGRVTVLDVTTSTPTLIASVWMNLTASTLLASAPTGGTFVEQTQHLAITSAIPTGSNTIGAVTVVGTVPVSALALPLPAGASTEATLGNLLTALNLKARLTDTQPVSAATLPLPAGASTSALQTTGNTSLASVDTKLTTTVNGLKVDNSAVTQPISAVLLPLPTGAATEATLAGRLKPSDTLSAVTSLGSIVGALPTGSNVIGRTGIQVAGADVAAGNPVPVTLPGVATSALQTTGNTSLASVDTKTPALVSGRVPVDGSGVIQPVSVVTLPLPAGASTAALQTSGNASLTSVDGKLTTTTNGLKVDNSGVTQPVSAAALPLPAGASTSVLQTTGNTSLASLDTKLPTPLAGRVPVDGSGVTQPVSAASLPLPTGAATSALQTAGNTSLASVDSKLTTSVAGLKVDGSGVTQPASVASMPLPTGAATAALQTTGNTSLTSIDGKLSTTAAGLKVDNSAVTQPVSAVTLPLPAGASTSALQTAGNVSLASVDTKTPALVAGRVPVDGSGVTQPVSASVLPLPTGASTSALQTAGNTSLASVDTKLTTTANGLKVDNSAVTQPVSAVALPLPAGASTSALQTSGNASLTSLDTKLPAKGSAVSAASTPVVIASDQTVPVSVASLPLPAGSSTAANQVTQITALAQLHTDMLAPTPAGTNLIGKVGLDQTVDGTTNRVAANLFVGGSAYTIGAKTIATALAFSLASDQAPTTPAQAWFSKITDGTTAITVKPASTASTALDTALVVIASPNSVPPRFSAAGTITNPSIVAGGTAQTLLAANPARRYLLVQNNSASDVWINFSGTAGLNLGLKIASGGAYENPPHFSPNGLVSVWGATTGQALSSVEA